jgi:hypothetical protein
MKLTELQWIFLKNLCELIVEIEQRGFTASGGELFRTPEQQAIYLEKGLSKTLNSMHLKKCAIDLFLFKDGILIGDEKMLQPIGDYWEGLHPLNRWGGNFPKWHPKSTFIDVPHFEMKI